MIDLTPTTGPTFGNAVVPSPVEIPAPSSEGTTLVTGQRVLFATAATAALPHVRPSRWSIAVRSMSKAMNAVVSASRPPAPSIQPGRSVYLENALMSRELDRL